MPSLNSISIIIPTFNRADLLAKVLRGYLEQSATDFIGELLVVDDGSSDPTQSVVDEIARRAPFPLRYIRQEHNGPAAARNLGIEKAQSDLILFTDSDIIPRLDLVEQHLEWHKQHPEFDTAMLGYVSWCPEMNPTPFMQWYGERGNLFCYGQLNAGQQVNHFFFYTCNLSLKTGFLRRYGRFDEEFRSAAFEDTELGFRLSKHGLRILYNPAAIGYHHQFFSFQAAV
jgi:glycosyltransferase involved in cell wall biosynthesis